MDERIMHLFTLIAEQATARDDLFDREDMIMQSLLNSGCHPLEADAALSLMQSLSQGPAGASSGATPVRTGAIRCMSRQERSRFDPEAFDFVLRLHRLGMISEEQRDELIDKAMAVHAGRIDLEQVQSLVAIMFFTRDHAYEFSGPEQESRESRDMTWN